jgi:Zn-dependent protease with chaperone function
MISPLPSRFDAAYYDGRAAVRHTVTVDVGTEGLIIAGESWPQGTWRVSGDGSYGEPVRVERDSGETLIVESPDFMEALRQHGLDTTKPSRTLRGWPQIVLCCLAIVAIGGAMYWWGIDWAAGQAARFMPLGIEDRLGRATVAILAPPESRCRDAAAQSRIQPVVDRLSTAAGRKFTIVYVDQEIVNAFAAPGGYIVVFRGLIEQTRTPEEFAGVLAHEMQHVLLKHSARAIAREFSGRALLSLMSVDSSGTPAAIQGAARLANLSYQRDDEEAADRAGLALLARAHVATGGLIVFLRRMTTQSSSGSGATKYLSTHPAMTERIEALDTQSKGAGGATPLMSVDEWRRAQRVCGGE